MLNAVGRDPIERLHFLAPGSGTREGGEKTQPFNWIHSRLFTTLYVSRSHQKIQVKLELNLNFHASNKKYDSQLGKFTSLPTARIVSSGCLPATRATTATTVR